MSKTLSVRPYLKFQKKDSNSLIPIYVQVTIDGDNDVFSVSCKVALENWDQAKQLCTAKSQEAKNINTKFSVVKGDLTRLFQQFPPGEIVRASQLIALYCNQDPDRKNPKTEKGPDVLQQGPLPH
jgi:hypothetical protein